MSHEIKSVEAHESLSEAYNRSLEEAFEEIDTSEFMTLPSRARRSQRKAFRRATKALLSAAIAVLAGCVSIPKGELQLGPKIAEDLKDQRLGGLSSLSRGRPVYLEAYAYPQMLETGDIWAGGPLLVNLGREELSLDQVVGDLGKPDEAPVAAPAASGDSDKMAHQKAKKKRAKPNAKTALIN